MAAEVPIHKVTSEGVTLPTAAKCYPRRTDKEGMPGELYCECGVTSNPEQWGADGEPNAIGPRCPHCGIQYELNASTALVEPPEDAPPICQWCGKPYRLDTSTGIDVWTYDCECPATRALQAGESARVELPPAESAPPAEPAPPTEPARPTEPAPPAEPVDECLVVLTPDRQAQLNELNSEWLDLDLRRELLIDKKTAFLDDWKGDISAIDERLHQVKSELRAIKRGETYEPPPAIAPAQLTIPGCTS